jgi:hypothetical protein
VVLRLCPAGGAYRENEARLNLGDQELDQRNKEFGSGPIEMGVRFEQEDRLPTDLNRPVVAPVGPVRRATGHEVCGIFLPSCPGSSRPLTVGHGRPAGAEHMLERRPLGAGPGNHHRRGFRQRARRRQQFRSLLANQRVIDGGKGRRVGEAWLEARLLGLAQGHPEAQLWIVCADHASSSPGMHSQALI